MQVVAAFAFFYLIYYTQMTKGYHGPARKSICNLLPESGPCHVSKLRYYFNQDKGQCLEFIYGGCMGNANRFHTKEQCEAQCAAEFDICHLPPGEGVSPNGHRCVAHKPSYYFNHEEGRCLKFIYTGCWGNANRFHTKEACEARCAAVHTVPKPIGSICHLPPDVGVSQDGHTCSAHMPRYYFNRWKGHCLKFIYGGCGGNANRFHTKEACEARCHAEFDICHLPPDAGVSPNGHRCLAHIPRYYFNRWKGRCLEFIYGGCGGNGNRFYTKEACEARCAAAPIVTKKPTGSICHLPLDVGVSRDGHTCLVHMPRYYFNRWKGRCLEFMYGGCGGNANRFYTKEACEARCHPEFDICYLPPDEGVSPNGHRCAAHMTSYYFNSEEGRCRKFIYTGCGGNANRFYTKEACEARCAAAPIVTMKPTGSICHLPLDVGVSRDGHTCLAHMPRYYFNRWKGRCLEFIYGGCGGNANRFYTKEACEARCHAKFDICHLPPDEGVSPNGHRCLAHMPRYYFNRWKGRCLEFIYGGCGGNANRFYTKEACEARCAAAPIVTKKPTGSICHLPLDVGVSQDGHTCLAHMPRYYFNRWKGHCLKFIYGGCGGNANRFHTKEACEARCHAEFDICHLPPDEGVSPNGHRCAAHMPRYYFNRWKGHCLEFIYGGCGGNANRFYTKEACEARCAAVPIVTKKPTGRICHLPLDVGVSRDGHACLAHMPRYYFNRWKGRCLEFIYGGCGGNANRFYTKQACEARCHAEFDICHLPPDEGVSPNGHRCAAHMTSYYFNSEEGRCLKFIYTGCWGNANRFHTKEACEARCAAVHFVSNKPTGSICHLPPEPGQCHAKKLRYYFNRHMGLCLKFIYGGCEGNANRFLTKTDCEAHCHRHGGAFDHHGGAFHGHVNSD